FKNGNQQELIGAWKEVGGKSAQAFVSAFKEGYGKISDISEDTFQIMDPLTIKTLHDFKQGSGNIWGAVKTAVGTAFASLIELLDPLGTEEKEKAIERANADRKSGKTIPDVDDDYGESASKEAKAFSEKIGRIQTQIDLEKRRGELAKMTNQEKAEYLKKEIADLEKKNSEEKDTLASAERSLEIQRKKNELESDQRANRHARGAPNHLAEIGGFIGGLAPDTSLNIARKSSDTLVRIEMQNVEINKNISKWLARTGSQSGATKY
ncbi:MAG: hypothetical protein ACEQSB_07475, partial [Undibacterium sp.]